MQIALALIYGAAVGALAHFTMPGRDTRGAGLAPVLGAVIGSGLWTALTWAGMGLGDPWLWLAGALVPPAAVYLIVAALTRVRRARDDRERRRLGIV